MGQPYRAGPDAHPRVHAGVWTRSGPGVAKWDEMPTRSAQLPTISENCSPAVYFGGGIPHNAQVDDGSAVVTRRGRPAQFGRNVPVVTGGFRGGQRLGRKTRPLPRHPPDGGAYRALHPNGSSGPWPRPRSHPAAPSRAAWTKRLAPATASGTPDPRASSAAVAEARLHPVPWLLRVTTS